VRGAAFLLSCAVSYLAAPGAVTKAPSSLGLAKKPPAGYVLGRSVGSPTEGRLLGGSHLDDAPYLRFAPAYAQGDVRWGVGPLVGLVDRAARQVRHQFPESVLSLGHLSRHGGGELERHASHESGRDADLGFYVRSKMGRPLHADHFVAFAGDGTAPSWPGAYFDEEQNWALVSALVTDPFAHVSHIFVASALRARLLAYAERVGAPLAVRVRASELMAQPHGALPHDDHFHVRISCPNGMNGCVENPTAPKPRFARVPLPHGRTRPVGAPHGIAPAGPAKIDPLPRPGNAPWSDDDTPAALMTAPVAGAPPAFGQRASVFPVDDVDGVLGADR
jgi:penicillin-insensitive murein endopeptidase